MFESGSRIGPYEITGTIGAGGMGDVYRARDTRLDRTVAIKVIRADFSERFEREAKAISALNHPHICTLHDVGHAEGAAYLVMEYVDGSPIAGPMPVGDVIKFGTQICDALHAAHRQNIVHRDLKPANILMTKAGIKLLDFGLAKPHAAPGESASEGVTVAALTGAHTVVGTLQYMAPEQIEGREADIRSDIFALGCVLYELVTGKRAFDGKSASSVMAAILATEPRKPSELAPVTPPALEWIILRCLEKDPDARWQSAHDVGMQLRWMAGHQTAPGSSDASSRKSFFPGLAAGVVLSAIAAGLWIWLAPSSGGGPASPSSEVASIIRLPDEMWLLDSSARSSVAISRDGGRIAFAGSTAATGGAIYLQPLDRFEPVKIEGTDGGSAPFFSPKGDWIGFVVDGLLKKVPVGGGAAVDVVAAPTLRGSVWLDDDTIVLSPKPVGGLIRVSAQGGGTPAAVTTLDAARNEKTHRSLIALPGGKSVVFVIGSDELETYDDARIVALTLDTHQITELVKGYAPVYLPTGHLLFVRNGSVFAVPFDPATLKVGGSPVQVLKDVVTVADSAVADFDVAANGTMIFAPGGDRPARRSARWIDRLGRTQAIGLQERPYMILDYGSGLLMSPDQRRLAFSVTAANNILWTYDLERKQTTRMTFRRDMTSFVWSPDSSHLTSWTGMDLRSMAADGSGQEDILVQAADTGGRQLFPAAWSADGRVLAITAVGPDKGDDIVLLRDGHLVPVLETRFDERVAGLSPDGRWLAYVSNETSRNEVYVLDLSASATKYPVTSEGADRALWTRGGRELLVSAASGPVAIAFTPGMPPTFGRPERIFGQMTADERSRLQDITPTADADRFLGVFNEPRPPLTEIRVITNWTQQLASLWR